MTKIIIFLLTISATCNALSSSKSEYHLMNPTPTNMRREFHTERPGKGITPHTVDGGHFQVESDVVNYKEDSEDDERSIGFFTTVLRLGLTNSTELQAEIETYVQEITNPEGSNRKKKDGLGDMILRLKQNLVGNDDGDFALALIPTAFIPTASAGLSPHNRTEGGLAIPMALKIGNELELELTLQFDTSNDNPELDWQSNYATALSFTYPIVEKIKGMIEVYNQYKQNPIFTNETTLNFALQYGLNERIKLDGGTFIGVSPEALDQEFFVGTSIDF